jgi:hypothetical protein
MKFNNHRAIRGEKGLFERALETNENIYFMNFKDKKKTTSIKMYDRKMTFLGEYSTAYFAFKRDLENYSWISPKLKKHLEVSN